MNELFFTSVPSARTAGGDLSAGVWKAFTYAGTQRALAVYNDTSERVLIEFGVDGASSDMRNVHIIPAGASLVIRHLEFTKFIAYSVVGAVVDGTVSTHTLSLLAYAQRGFIG